MEIIVNKRGENQLEFAKCYSVARSEAIHRKSTVSLLKKHSFLDN